MSFLEQRALLVSVALSVLLGYVVAIVARRVFFHPLSKFPGPFLGKVTDWYSVFHVFKGDGHVNLYDLHQTYGPVVRFGPNRLSFNNAKALQDIYGPKANTIKANYYTVNGHFFGALNIVSTVNVADNSRKRRVIGQALSPAAIKAMEHHILINVRLFCNLLVGRGGSASPEATHGTIRAISSNWSPALNVPDVVNWLTFDIMSDVCFGQNMEMLTEKRNRWILQVLPESIKGLHIFGHMPSLLKLKLDALLSFSKMAKDMETFKSLSQKQAETRMKKGQNIATKDVFYHLMNAKDPETGKGFSGPELVAEAGVLMIAGSDTTALAISSTIFYLVHNPEKLALLTKEISSAFSDVESIRPGPLLSSCQYLRACLDEAMRLTPATGGVLPREILCGGAAIDGHHLPPGTVVGVAHYALHHNPEYFPSPFAYKPERWILNEKEGVDADALTRAQSAFCQFSIGPRSCIGKQLAYHEMSVPVARVVWLFDMRLSSMETRQSGTQKAGFLEVMRTRNECPTHDKFVSKSEDFFVGFRPKQPA